MQSGERPSQIACAKRTPLPSPKENAVSKENLYLPESCKVSAVTSLLHRENSPLLTC